jgi:GT2 family glycosyltransferase
MTAQPLLDIVMLVHDCVEWADLAIRAVEYQTKNRYRLILVDMASQEQKTKDVLAAAEQRGHTVVRLAENRSFSNGVNAGVRAGSAPNIVILNDDAFVTEGWDGHFLTELAAGGVGMVGARTNYALGAMGDSTFLRGTEAPFLVFVCVGLRREVWDRVGPMDGETFDGFSSEDLDYSWRVIKAGLKLYVSNAYVLHAGSKTLARKGVDQSAETRARYEQKYNTRLRQKWTDDWVASHSRHQPNVLVAAYSATEWVRGDFARAVVTLKASDYPFTYMNQRRMAIHLARQVVADYAVDNGFDVLIQLDDDATFPADLLPRLINHGKDVVCALAYQRFAPYATVAYDLDASCFDAGGSLTLDKEGLRTRCLDNLEGQGLRKVDITGFHCSAIRTSVFKKLRAAGIRQYYGGFENKLGEDFAACLNLRKVDVPIYLDTDLVSGHIGENVIITREYKALFKAGRAP